LRGAINLARNN